MSGAKRLIIVIGGGILLSHIKASLSMSSTSTIQVVYLVHTLRRSTVILIQRKWHRYGLPRLG
jgi:hypothetical protein